MFGVLTGLLFFDELFKSGPIPSGDGDGDGSMFLLIFILELGG